MLLQPIPQLTYKNRLVNNNWKVSLGDWEEPEIKWFFKSRWVWRRRGGRLASFSFLFFYFLCRQLRTLFQVGLILPRSQSGADIPCRNNRRWCCRSVGRSTLRDGCDVGTWSCRECHNLERVKRDFWRCFPALNERCFWGCWRGCLGESLTEWIHKAQPWNNWEICECHPLTFRLLRRECWILYPIQRVELDSHNTRIWN